MLSCVTCNPATSGKHLREYSLRWTTVRGELTEQEVISVELTSVLLCGCPVCYVTCSLQVLAHDISYVSHSSALVSV